MLAGDFNETIRSSPMLAAALGVGTKRVSPDDSSTMGKNRHVAKRQPIDHTYMRDVAQVTGVVFQKGLTCC